ncbi:MAG: ABC transporter permease [Saprospiraceae bacterium]|nr:ABC transporter permease [Saprospiraceae bacterium]
MKTSIRFSYLYLGLCLIVSVLGYLITPDQSRYCNTQVLENSFLNPGTKKCFLNSNNSTSRTIEDIVFGKEDFTKLILDLGGTSNCKLYILGTDRYGRDLLSRLIIGMRYTLIISLLSVLFACFIGIIAGSFAGYYGGRTDKIISFFVGIFWALPTILLAFVILMSFGRNITSLCVAIGLTLWADIARLVRGQVIAFKENNFVSSAIVLGFSDMRIILSQIFPNIAGPILIQFSGNFALAVLLESGLSFLGMGLQAPVPTLGNILQDQYTQAFNGQILQSSIPAIVLVLLILSFQLLASEYRDKLDVKLINR